MSDSSAYMDTVQFESSIKQCLTDFALDLTKYGEMS